MAQGSPVSGVRSRITAATQEFGRPHHGSIVSSRSWRGEAGIFLHGSMPKCAIWFFAD
ncbi:hypothetical protein IG631_05940 [Alternaria alternata]|nr:hypothetical protein IG631_05940 [Alternaria alternata]